jgi:membrane-associated phospholipid phosphatase
VSDSTAESRMRVREAILLVVGYAAWVAGYDAVGTYASKLPAWDLTTSVDQAIPLVPRLVWAYEVCYVLPFFSLFVIRDPRRFVVARWSIALSVVVAFAAYLVVPVSFERPVITGTTISERVLAFEYAMDFTPTVNNWPSLHVAISWIIGRAMLGQRGRVADALVVAAVIAITVSTVAVKQHLVVDVLAGALLAVAAWRVIAMYASPVGTTRDRLPRSSNPACSSARGPRS